MFASPQCLPSSNVLFVSPECFCCQNVLVRHIAMFPELRCLCLVFRPDSQSFQDTCSYRGRLPRGTLLVHYRRSFPSSTLNLWLYDCNHLIAIMLSRVEAFHPAVPLCCVSVCACECVREMKCICTRDPMYMCVCEIEERVYARDTEKERNIVSDCVSEIVLSRTLGNQTDPCQWNLAHEIPGQDCIDKKVLAWRGHLSVCSIHLMVTGNRSMVIIHTAP